MSTERYALNKQLAQMLNGGVIMDVTTPELDEDNRIHERFLEECRLRSARDAFSEKRAV